MKFSILPNFLAYCTLKPGQFGYKIDKWQMAPQDPATPIMEGMVSFHHYLMFFLITIGILVFYMLMVSVINFHESKHPIAEKFTHSSELEIGWTIFPAVILLIIAIPSFQLLYSLDDVLDPSITLKIIGHQWYWSYEYSDYSSWSDCGYTIAFDSYILPVHDAEYEKLAYQLKKYYDTKRLLQVDTPVVLPMNTRIRVLVTSSDVIHSWAIPAFGIKIDATPGRLTQGSLFIKRAGVFVGQCSEICGVNHAFMPSQVTAVTLETYLGWVQTALFSPETSSSRIKLRNYL